MIIIENIKLALRNRQNTFLNPTSDSSVQTQPSFLKEKGLHVEWAGDAVAKYGQRFPPSETVVGPECFVFLKLPGSLFLLIAIRHKYFLPMLIWKIQCSPQHICRHSGEGWLLPRQLWLWIPLLGSTLIPLYHWDCSGCSPALCSPSRYRHGPSLNPQASQTGRHCV